MKMPAEYGLVAALALLAASGFADGGIAGIPFEMKPVPEATFPARDFAVTGFGAKPGEKCTSAFAAAMAECEREGGGRVIVPKGRWLAGAVHFRSNCNLHLAEGAVLEFTDDPADYLPAVHTSWEGVECLNYSPLLYAYGVTNVAITGKGTIAPRMTRWREWFLRPPEHVAATERLYHWCSTNAPMASRDVTKLKGSNFRPHLMQFNRCRGVLLDGFRIRESPFWMIHLYHSEDCIVRNLDTRAHGHNNDGVDVEMTRNVIIENCRFDQGDDGIVIKAGRNLDGWRLNRPSENVVVTNCILKAGHTLLGLGSELSGGIRNVYVSNCRMASAFNLLYVKTNRRRGGFVENVYLENIETGDVLNAMLGLKTDVLYQWAAFPDYELRRTRIRGIHLKNVHAKCADWMFNVEGDAEAPAEDLEFENVSLAAARRGKERILNAKNVTQRDVELGNGKPTPWKPMVDENWHKGL